MYVPTGTGLLRQARMPISQPVPVPPENTDPQSWRCWIDKAWTLPGIAEAVTAASGDLARAVRTVLSDQPAPKNVLRTGSALLQYVLRTRYRATPFGLFASTSPIRLDGPSASIDDASEHVVVRPDALWVDRLLSRLHADPKIVGGLSVVADPTCVLKDDHFEVPYRPGTELPERVRARATPPMREVMAMAQRPVSVANLVEHVLADRPGVPREVVVAMISQALCSGLLHSDLRPATTRGFPLQHVLSRLNADGPESAAKVHTILSDVESALPATDGSASQGAERARATMNELVGGSGNPLVYDVHRPTPVHLPPRLADDAVKALEVMARISPHPTGSPSWQEYRARYFDRYSLGVLVPLRELLDPVTGLGYPTGYRDSSSARREAPVTERDRYLMARIQRLDRDGDHELVLDEQDLDALHVGDAAQVWATTEVTIAVHATSPCDLERGDYELVLEGLSSSLGVLTGRFLPLLSAEEQRRDVATHRSAPTLGEGAVRVQVGAPPLRRRVRNVTGTLQLVPEVLALGEYDEESTMFPDEIAIGASAECLYLVHTPTMHRIEPFLANAVEPTATTPPLARFLTELPRSHAAVLTPFDWGAAARLPFLPRVRHGRVVLSPARWLLSWRDLGGCQDPAQAVLSWATRERVPRVVSAGDTDARLRLDLYQGAHRRLLAHLVKNALVSVQEEPEDTGHGWLGHASQVTLGFVSDQDRLPVSAPVFGAVHLDDGDLRRPGSSKHLLLRVDTPTDLTCEVFASGLADLLGEPPALRWWFTRYRDPEPHLRVRITLQRPADFAALAAKISDWAGQAHREHLAAGISWHVDQPETGRYGTGETLNAAEDFFAQDSRCALLQDDPARTPAQREALLVASLIDITAAVLGSDDDALHLWDQAARPARSWPPIGRETRAGALRLCADPTRHALLDLHGGQQVQAAWQARSEALRAYAAMIRVQGHVPRAVLPALLHMHHARAFGVDSDHEQLTHHRTREIAHSVTTRRAARG
jgi:lantibiotic biosynthesis protein